jgi:hypothetical protein
MNNDDMIKLVKLFENQHANTSTQTTQLQVEDTTLEDTLSKKYANFKDLHEKHKDTHITELSTELLGRYKTAAGKSASAADVKKDFKTGNKRFSGIMKATNKQFDNDAKASKEKTNGQGVTEGSVWSSADQKMKHHSEFPHTHTAAKDIQSSMSGEVIVPKGARLSALGNDNYLNLDTGVQPYKLRSENLVRQGVSEATDKKAKQIASLKKKIDAAKDSLSLAKEQRRMKGQLQQGPREIALARKISDLNKAIHAVQTTKDVTEATLWAALGEEDESTLNPTDAITMDIPLVMRMMEYAREDASTDMDLHHVVEKMIELGKDGHTLSMQDYNSIVEIQNEQIVSELGANGSAISSVARAQSLSPTTQPAVTTQQTQANASPTTGTTSSSPTTQPAGNAALLNPDDQAALDKIMTNAGLKGQLQQLMQKAKTVPGA